MPIFNLSSVQLFKQIRCSRTETNY